MRFLRYNRAESRGITGNGSWWIDKLTSAPATWKPSKSWSVAPVLYQLVNTGIGIEIPGPTRSFRPGDVLFYNLPEVHGGDYLRPR